jgi:hypothetical protein
MVIRVIESSGCVYADLGIKKRRNPHHGSTLDSFLAEEAAGRRLIAEADAAIAAGRVASYASADDMVADIIGRGASRKRPRAGKQKAKASKPSGKAAVGKKARKKGSVNA